MKRRTGRGGDPVWFPLVRDTFAGEVVWDVQLKPQFQEKTNFEKIPVN